MRSFNADRVPCSSSRTLPFRRLYYLRTTWCRRALVLAACCGVMFGPFGTGWRADAQQERVKAVVAAWRGRQTQFDTIRFRFSGTHSTPAGFTSVISSPRHKAPYVQMPSRDTSDPIEEEILLDFQNLRLRRHTIGQGLLLTPDTNEFVSIPRDDTVFHNGQQFKQYKPHDLNLEKAPISGATQTELSIYKGPPRVVIFELEAMPLLYACGIIAAGVRSSPENLKPELQAAAVRLHSETVMDGRPILVLRTVPDLYKTFHEYWVEAADPRVDRKSVV